MSDLHDTVGENFYSYPEDPAYFFGGLMIVSAAGRSLKYNLSFVVFLLSVILIFGKSAQYFLNTINIINIINTINTRRFKPSAVE
jgi:hypothetical protein